MAELLGRTKREVTTSRELLSFVSGLMAREDEALRRVREHRNLMSWEGSLDQMRERQPAVAREGKGTYGATRRHKRAR